MEKYKYTLAVHSAQFIGKYGKFGFLDSVKSLARNLAVYGIKPFDSLRPAASTNEEYHVYRYTPKCTEYISTD